MPNQGLEAMIAKCESFLGTSGRPNEATRWYAARNGAYYANAPWCNMFITWAAYHSGNYNTVCFAKDYAYTVYHAQRFQEAGQWHPDVAGIQRGDIVFFDWGGSNYIAAIDHIGIVTGVNGRDIMTIEGNTADKCARRVRRQEEIVGFGRPAYVASPVTPPPKPEESVEPAHNYARTTYGGRTVNQRTKVMLENAAKIFGKSFVLTQGSYSKGVSASAGTHDGGGVVDISVGGMSPAQRDAAVQALRKAGFFAWLRVPPAFDYHIHAVAIGDKEMSSAAKSQVVQGFADRDGLARRGPDPAPDPYPAWTAKYGKHVSPDPPGQLPGPPPPRPVPPAGPYKPPPFPAGLRPNDSSPSARGLQRALKAAGYLNKSVAESDNYGPLTQAAVKRFHDRNPQYAEKPGDPAIGPRGWAELHREAYA